MDTTFTTTEYATSTQNVAAMMSMLIIPILLIAVFFIICMWRIYTKAGKPGWASIVPIYNYIVMLEIVGKPIWWFLLMLIPVVNIIFGIWMLNLLSKSFGKGAGFTIGILLLPYIFLPILAFSSAKYIGPAGQPAFQPMQ